jgi:hypothetical protein
MRDVDFHLRPTVGSHRCHAVEGEGLASDGDVVKEEDVDEGQDVLLGRDLLEGCRP